MSSFDLCHEAYKSADAGDYATATMHCNRILQTNPDCEEAHILLGDIHNEEGRHADAIRSFSNALCTDPNNEIALVGRSTAYLNSSLEQATADFDRAWEINANYAWAKGADPLTKQKWNEEDLKRKTNAKGD